MLVTHDQLPRPRTWPAWQTEHTGHEGGYVRRMCATIVVATGALHRRYDHHNR